MCYVKCLFCGNSLIIKFPEKLEVIEKQMKEHVLECTKVEGIVINPLAFFELRGN